MNKEKYYEENSSYLYADKNKELYLNTYKIKSCPQSYNIFLLLEKDDSDNSLNRLSQHVIDCEICQSKLKILRSYSKKLNGLIPSPKISKSLQQDFEHDLSQLLKDIKTLKMSKTNSMTFWFSQLFSKMRSTF